MEKLSFPRLRLTSPTRGDQDSKKRDSPKRGERATATSSW